MLNIGRMGRGSSNYYLDAVARTQVDYYHGHGEAPGRWMGSGLDGLELEAGLQVTREALGRVLDGAHPTTGERVASHPARQVPGFDLTFRAPKSVSLLWGLGDEQVASQLQAAHDAAVTATLSYLEEHVARSRRGAGGTEQVAVDGLVAAAFTHLDLPRRGPAAAHPPAGGQPGPHVRRRGVAHRRLTSAVHPRQDRRDPLPDPPAQSSSPAGSASSCEAPPRVRMIAPS